MIETESPAAGSTLADREAKMIEALWVEHAISPTWLVVSPAGLRRIRQLKPRRKMPSGSMRRRKSGLKRRLWP